MSDAPLASAAASALEATARLARTQLLLLDVDGVLTDGRLYIGADGETFKAFDVRDGLGLRLAAGAGLTVGIVTGRRSAALARRLTELDIALLFDAVQDKAAVLNSIAQRTGIAPEHMAFAGDDLPDLPLMRRVGLAIAVADAHPRVRREAGLVTAARGGHGAVREVCEAWLQATGRWSAVLQRFA